MRVRLGRPAMGLSARQRAAVSGRTRTQHDPWLEPNVDATSITDLRTTLSDADLEVLQEAADFIADRELVPTRVTMADHVDQSLMTAVADELTDADVDSVRVTDP